MKKRYGIIIIMGILFTCLTGCFKRYPSYREDAERKLKKKYGEDFEISKVFDCQEYGYRVYAHPVERPEIVFKCTFNISDTENESEYTSDQYIQTLVGAQYGEQAKKVLDETGYNYYLSTEFWCHDYSITDTDITPEDFLASAKEVCGLDYTLYIEDDILEKDDSYLYEMLVNMQDTWQGDMEYFHIYVWLMEDSDIERVRQELMEVPELSVETYRDMELKYMKFASDWHLEKERFITFPLSAGKVITNLDEFSADLIHEGVR